MNSKVYKWCMIRHCKNTSKKNPSKLFVYVPNDKKMRNKWLTFAKRDPAAISQNSPVNICEDHFDMPNDMENYMKYHLMGSVSQIRMIPGCVPTKYQCQERRTTNATERPNILKKRKKKFIVERAPCGSSGQTVHEHETESESEEIKEEMTTSEEEIKEEITIDEDDNFIPCMQSLLKTEEDPLESEDQLSHVIGHDHSYQAAIQTQPFHQTSVEDSSLNDKIFTNMAMELQRQKTLNDKKQNTIEELRQQVKKQNSQLIKQNLLLEKYQSQINILKSTN